MDSISILSEISNRWKVSGFSSSRSLGLYLRRYRFKKKDKYYKIERDNIDLVRRGIYGY